MPPISRRRWRGSAVTGWWMRAYGYRLNPTTSARNVTSAIIPIASRDMIHVKYSNPLNAYFGQAPLRPAARAVSLDNAATDFVDTMLRNYAVPGVVIKTATEVD